MTPLPTAPSPTAPTAPTAPTPSTDGSPRAVPRPLPDPLVVGAVAGDDRAFSALVHRHRPALHAHCRRMLGAGPDAEDAVQEALLRAWRRRGTFEGRSSFGWWLHRVATNACIDIARRTARAPTPWPGLGGDDHDGDPGAPGPGAAGPGTVDPGADVADQVATRDAVEHAYLVALRVLPARQRAVLVLQDVLGYPAADTAELLGGTVASVNSALQRARATLDRRRRVADRPGPATPAEQEVVRRLVLALEHADPWSVLATLSTLGTTDRLRPDDLVAA